MYVALNEGTLQIILLPVVPVVMSATSMMPVLLFARPQPSDVFFQFNSMENDKRKTDADGQFPEGERLCFQHVVHKGQVYYCHLQRKCCKNCDD